MQHPGESHLHGSARTDPGRVRNNNEDQVHLWEKSPCLLAIVADGMGGAVAGEEASRIAVDTIRQLIADHNNHNTLYKEWNKAAIASYLEEYVRRANLEILRKTNLSPELKGMGTTLTMAFVRHTNVILAHVGDSRAYLVHGEDGSITQLTSDHSFVQALVEAGHITADEAKNHPMKNVLYRALGQTRDIDIDINSDIHLAAGDKLVLCSDGLTLHVIASEIAEIVHAEPDPHSASQKLIELANQRGGKDNISVIVIQANYEHDALETKRAQSQKQPASPSIDTSDAILFYSIPSPHYLPSQPNHYGNSKPSSSGLARSESPDILEPPR